MGPGANQHEAAVATHEEELIRGDQVRVDECMPLSVLREHVRHEHRYLDVQHQRGEGKDQQEHVQEVEEVEQVRRYDDASILCTRTRPAMVERGTSQRTVQRTGGAGR